MKRRIVLLVFLKLLVCSFTTAYIQPISDAPIRVLFIGNSYTYFNNLPGVLVELSQSREGGPQIIAEMVVAGGATLKQHFEGANALNKIKKGNWDFAVLREQSTLGRSKYVNGIPTINDPGMFHKYARLLHSEITKQGAQTILMLTWAREKSPQYQANLTDAYMTIGKELGAKVAPVGLVWAKVINKVDGLSLYMEDGSHPSPQGTYLAACVFYTTITGKSPVNLPHLVKTPALDMAGKLMKSGESTQKIELSPENAALIHEEIWSTHQRLLQSGGYIDALPTKKLQEPSVPQGIEFTNSDIIGVWDGSAVLGLSPNPAELVVDLIGNGQGLEAKISLDFEGVFVPDQNREIKEIDATQARLRFSHPLKMTYEDVEALLKYELVFTGSSLCGIARMFFKGKERGISEVELRPRQ